MNNITASNLQYLSEHKTVELYTPTLKRVEPLSRLGVT